MALSARSTDHFFITGPAVVSFSGGRTSGYMLHEIVRAHGGKLPPDVVVVFANTGKEREETLRFVRECELRWRINCQWVEWRDNDNGFDAVSFETASRCGEPFARLIKKKMIPPNWQARYCTQYLKIRAMTRFAQSIGFSAYAEVIGLRYDEGRRILVGMENAERYGRHVLYPLAKAKVRKADVAEFWRGQAFDLSLPPGGGNCDLCFLKSAATRRALIQKWPGCVDWWSEQERNTAGFFDRRISYSDLARQARAQPDLFDVIAADDDFDVECGLSCA